MNSSACRVYWHSVHQAYRWHPKHCMPAEACHPAFCPSQGPAPWHSTHALPSQPLPSQLNAHSITYTAAGRILPCRPSSNLPHDVPLQHQQGHRTLGCVPACALYQTSSGMPALQNAGVSPEWRTSEESVERKAYWAQAWGGGGQKEQVGAAGRVGRRAVSGLPPRMKHSVRLLLAVGWSKTRQVGSQACRASSQGKTWFDRARPCSPS